eukprot:1160609-Pelagomonas_calceolata.AAC.3
MMLSRPADQIWQACGQAQGWAARSRKQVALWYAATRDKSGLAWPYGSAQDQLGGASGLANCNSSLSIEGDQRETTPAAWRLSPADSKA